MKPAAPTPTPSPASPADPPSPRQLLIAAARLHREGRREEARAGYEEVLRAQPDNADAHHLLGILATDAGDLDRAESLIARACALAPGTAHFHHSLAVVYVHRGEFDRVLDCEARATALNPEDAGAQWNMALARLALGDYERGWPQYEWRWKSSMASMARPFAQPAWRGEPLDGRTILLHAEQGFGDTLQFCRYVPLVARRGGRVVLEVQAPLAALMAGLEGVERTVVRGEPLPAFDTHCPLLSLPLAFGTTLATVPREVPYLRADAPRIAKWQGLLRPRTRPRIGLAWSGSLANTLDTNRSLSLAELVKYLPPGNDYVSLQKEVRAGDDALMAAAGIRDFRAELDDFADTAALCSQLDRVIAVDTSVAHLAGALACDTWVLLAHGADWRWLRGRDDSPWYPTARLWRQPSRGDWGGILSLMRSTLATQ